MPRLRTNVGIALLACAVPLAGLAGAQAATAAGPGPIVSTPCAKIPAGTLTFMGANPNTGATVQLSLTWSGEVVPDVTVSKAVGADPQLGGSSYSLFPITGPWADRKADGTVSWSAPDWGRVNVNGFQCDAETGEVLSAHVYAANKLSYKFDGDAKVAYPSRPVGG